MDEATKNADIVKTLHKTLRNKVKKGFLPDQVWSDLLKDSDTLSEYSRAMSALALKHWPKDSSQSRIKWTHDVCLEYFYNGGMLKAVRRQFKQQLFRDLHKKGEIETKDEKLTIEVLLQNFDFGWKSLVGEKLVLLDVGSCFNAFKDFHQFLVFPIDIAPATEDVYKLDFLNISFKEIPKYFTPDESSLASQLCDNLTNNLLLKSVFDVVVFSLLLCYLPTPEQRLQCCVNAHISLRLYGLLVIITPDSSHQNRNANMMVSWRNALEGIGFVRYRYTKLDHLHCMAYLKITESVAVSSKDFSKYLFIPQDFQEIDYKLGDNKEFNDLDSGNFKLFSPQNNIDELAEVFNLAEVEFS